MGIRIKPLTLWEFPDTPTPSINLKKETSAFINYRKGDLGRISIQNYVWWPSDLKPPPPFLQSTAALFWFCENLVKVVLKSVTSAKSHVLPSTFEHSGLGSFPDLKFILKRAFLWGIKVWVGFRLGEGGGGRIRQKKQTRRITITFPSHPCPRV